MNRRQALIASGLGTMSLGMPGAVMGADKVDASGQAVASNKSCIFVLLCGGPSHIDTWDYKPGLEKANGQKLEGFDPTTAVLNSPDNLAQDALGNIYVVEDAPNGDPVGGDIWFARDTDNDGVAESLDHFMSIRADGSEATGLVFNPVDPTEFVIAVQHPDSTHLAVVPDGLGDAVWKFEISQIANQDFVTKLKLAYSRPTVDKKRVA